MLELRHLRADVLQRALDALALGVPLRRLGRERGARLRELESEGGGTGGGGGGGGRSRAGDRSSRRTAGRDRRARVRRSRRRTPTPRGVFEVSPRLVRWPRPRTSRPRPRASPRPRLAPPRPRLKRARRRDLGGGRPPPNAAPRAPRRCRSRRPDPPRHPARPAPPRVAPQRARRVATNGRELRGEVRAPLVQRPVLPRGSLERRLQLLPRPRVEPGGPAPGPRRRRRRRAVRGGRGRAHPRRDDARARREGRTSSSRGARRTEDRPFVRRAGAERVVVDDPRRCAALTSVPR